MPNAVLDAVSVGKLAADAAGHTGNAVVIARFERSFYLDLGASLISIGDESLHDGPLNIRAIAPTDLSLTTDLVIVTRQCWMVSSERLRRYDGLEIDLRHATIWQPERPDHAPDHQQLRHGLDHLLTLLRKRNLEHDGLVRLVLDGTSAQTATERAAKPYIDALQTESWRWLLDDAPTDPRPAIQLLGLGPGLTPSGDDLLAGVLIAWHHLGAATAASRLGPHLLKASTARTTPISLAHLRAAACGYGASPLHRLLNAVTANRHAEVAEALDAAAKIGHSSGLDAIAGMVLAMTAWLQAEEKMPLKA